MTILPADNKMSERAQLKNLSIIKDKTYDRGLNVCDVWAKTPETA